MSLIAWCSRCKHKTDLKEPNVHSNAKGNPYAKGCCSTCGKINVVALPKSYLDKMDGKDRDHLKQGGFLPLIPLLLGGLAALATTASGVAGIVTSTRATNAQIDALKGASGKGIEAAIPYLAL